MATCNPQFPLYKWGQLHDQGIIRLNPLRTSRVSPNVSVYACIFGAYNFNKSPLAPPCTKLNLHCKLRQQKSWGYHGYNVWYIRPIMQHYRCIKCWIPDTRSKVNANTLTMLPTIVPIPRFEDEEALEQALS
eukprot:2603521-Ditylum_brightwellii.AAC.1